MNSFTDIFRYELKYLISPSVVPRIRKYLRAYCSPDPNSKENDGYGILSLYLDTPQRQFVLEKKQNLANRQKLRVRTYADDPTADVHLEVKRRMQDLVHKTRATLPKNCWLPALNQPSQFKDSFSNERAYNNLKKFKFEVQTKACSPCMLIYYQREAFVSDVDKYARVTFDRNLRYQPQKDWSLTGNPNSWKSLDRAQEWGYADSMIVLELKCEEKVPLWMLRLIKEFDLTRCGFSKYVNSYEISQRGEAWDLLDLVPRSDIQSDA